MTEPSRHTEIGECIAGRYRIEELLGRGGMATVYRALDLRTDRYCALKRGWAGDVRKTQRRGALLEREYHTLAQLAHPRIIEVYEYGVDERGPFYTMELLAGTDLDAGGRLPWRRACALLHDVASSLAILHARGLLHRDLSLRNIRCTPEDRAKLIDFGAMAPMGVAKDVQGTAPFIAPEVLQMQELDARADLFALGAVGYYLLTGRTAYPARRMHELRDVWRSRPVPPQRIVPDVPAPLSALIVQLLALDRGARPKSAAEVIERLCTIAGLPREDHIEVSRAYLATPALVGRDAVLVAARREILSLVRREGGTLLIEGASGSGRSRMLDACVLEGKLLGMTVVRADAGDAAEGDWGVARALCNQLGALMPDVAAEAARLSRDVLAQVLDHTELDPSATASHAERSLLLRELREYVLSFVRNQPLVFVIDDVDEIDEPSAALLAAVAHKAKRNPLLLVLTLEREQGPSSSAPLRLLRLVGKSVQLEPLSAEQCEALLGSIFGDVSHLQLVAARVHELAQGNPRAILDVAQHLVESGLARYSAGSWLLPAQLDERALPATLGGALAARLETLGPDARALAEVQAVADGEALDVGAYAELSRIDEHKRIFAALDELVAARVFRLDGDGYSFSQRGFIAILCEQLSSEASLALHARVADRMRHQAGDVLRRADHLLHAQRAREAIELLNSVNLQLASPSVSLLERAIAEAEQLAVPARTLQRLREAVVAKASLVLAVESFHRHLPKVFEQLERDSGLSLYGQLAELQPAERLQQALLQTQQRYLATPEEQRVYSPIDAIRELARLSGAMCSVALQSYDYALLESLPSLLPLQSLSPALAIINQLVTAS
ncbi:MAG TPA: protein kinase, partial [Polyangiales bacterium]|nr:protein kinase [Polyangiales bacterium]